MSTKRKLLTNFLSLAILQGLNYILPLVTVPYLTRTVGIGGYGLIALGQAMNVLFVTFTDYGFNLTATKQISIAKEQRGEVQRIHSAVMGTKLLLMLVSFLILLIICLTVPPFNEHKLFFLAFFGITVGTVLFPVYLFQGMEEMKYITILNVISKTIFTLGLFLFIRSEDDLLYVPFFMSAGFIVVGIASLVLIRFRFGVRLQLPKLADMKEQLRGGWSVFVSNVAISAFTAGNTVILGLLGSKTQVGYYAGAEKLINAATSAVNPIAQTLFPHVSSLAHESREQAIAFLRKSLRVILLVTAPITLVTLIGADWIVTLFFGQHYPETVLALRLLSVLPMIIGLNNLLGVQTMLAFGYDKEFLRIMLVTTLISVVCALLLVPPYGYLGTVFTVLITEISITIREYWVLRKYGIHIFGAGKGKAHEET